KNSDEETIIVKPTDPNTILDLENKVKHSIKNSDKNFKINHFKNTRKVIVIKVPKSPTTDILIKEINNNPNIGSLGTAYKPRPKDPTIVIKGIPADTDLTSINQQIVNKNEDLIGLEEEIKLLFQLK